MAGGTELTRKLSRYFSIYALLILIFFIQICLALYEDQVDLFDWRQQYVGKVKFAYFDQYSHNSRRAWVATHSNVIAALNARTGSIIWRKVFEEKNGKVDSLLHHANALISISESGKRIRSWDPNKGHLQWEAVSEIQKVSNNHNDIKGMPGWGAALVGRKGIHSTPGVAVLFGNAVRVHGLRDGSVLWSWKADISESDYSDSSCLAMLIDGDNLHVLIKKNQIILEIVTLDIDSGSVQSRVPVAAKWLSHNSIECIFVARTNLVCLDIMNSNLMLMDLGSSAEGMSEIPLSTLNNDELTQQASLYSLGDNFQEEKFILALDNKTQNLIEIAKDSKSVSIVHSFPSKAYLKSSASSSSNILVSLVPEGVNLKIQIFDLSNFRELTKLSQDVKLDGYHGVPEFGAIYVFSKKDNELGYKLLIAFEDHALCLLHQSGSILWKREEALAGITSVEMIELPAATSASKLELLHEEFAALPNGKVLLIVLAA